MAGRPPKAIEQHKLDGTYRKDRHDNRGTQLQKIRDVKIPESISPVAAELWRQIVPELCKADLITDVDIPALEYAFYCYGLALELRSIAEEYPGGKAAYIANCKRMEKDVLFESRRYMNEFNSIMMRFGMTPVERARIKGNAPENPDSDDPVSRIIGDG